MSAELFPLEFIDGNKITNSINASYWKGKFVHQY